MTQEHNTPPLHTYILRIMEDIATDTNRQDSWVTIIALLCLFCIISRQPRQPAIAAQAPAAALANPLHKLLGELVKGDGGAATPDLLVSLLPLLNSPQLKNKLTSGNLSTILGLVNQVSAGSREPERSNAEADAPAEKKSLEIATESAAAAITQLPPPTLAPQDSLLETKNNLLSANKPAERYLNWKRSF